jgi:mono/diheme cytochrome c family protein
VKPSLVVGILALLAACAAEPPPAGADTALIERGHALAVRNCGQCHAVEREGRSPLPAAPPFRTLEGRYPIESLAESLAEGIISGHPEMPERAFAPEDVDAFLAYLATL